MRFYVTAKGKTRQHEFGVLQLGDPHVNLARGTARTLPKGLSHYQFKCTALEGTGDVTFTNGLLHMHTKGVQMSTQHFRNGQPLATARQSQIT